MIQELVYARIAHLEAVGRAADAQSVSSASPVSAYDKIASLADVLPDERRRLLDGDVFTQPELVALMQRLSDAFMRSQHMHALAAGGARPQ